MACSSSSSPASPVASDTDASPQVVLPVCDGGGLTVAFNPMYSAYDGMHTFSIPAIVVGANDNVVWSADSTYVGMMSDSERPNEVLLTMQSAGDTTIVVTSVDGTKCATAQLHIEQSTPQNWMIGEARYNDGKSVVLNSAAGTTLDQGSGGPACTSCHGETATGGLFTDVSHTPEQTGGFSDQDILNIVLHGEFPEGGAFDPNIVSYTAWHAFHQWDDIMPSQQLGIVTYLRSLTPEPQKGAPNFNVFMPDSGPPAVPDAAADAGATDGGQGDGGEPIDSGEVDSTVSTGFEGGAVDSGQPEASTVDAALDALASEAGPSDAGAAEPDAGESD